MRRDEIERHFAPQRQLLEAADWVAMCDAFERPLPSTFWANQTRLDPEEITRGLRLDGHELTRIPYVPGGYIAPTQMKLGRRFESRAGLFHLQEAASMLPPLVLGARPGEVVLDLCAAPGGKSAQLALQMQNRGTLVVNDLSFERLRALRAMQERLGLRNVVLCAQEGQTLLNDHPPVFDRVLVDAPCSCEGTLRKRGKWTFKPDRHGDFKRDLIETQRALLTRALRLTRAGGRVVYSTCTLDPEENEGVVAAVLEAWTHERARDATLAPIYLEPITLPHLRARSGITSWSGQVWSAALKRTLRVYPQDHDTGGFFIASLRVGGSGVEMNLDGVHDRELEGVSGAVTLRPDVDVDADADAVSAAVSDAVSDAVREARSAWRRPDPLSDERYAELFRWSERAYGLTPERFRDIALIAGNTRYISSISADLLTPPTRYQVAGLPTLYTRGAVPRLTSAAALEWGGVATRGVCDLELQSQVDTYYRGDEQEVPRAHVTGERLSGTYITRYRGLGIGLGDLSMRDETLTLRSGYPKRYWLSADRSAFESPQAAARAPLRERE